MWTRRLTRSTRADQGLLVGLRPNSGQGKDQTGRHPWVAEAGLRQEGTRWRIGWTAWTEWTGWTDLRTVVVVACEIHGLRIRIRPWSQECRHRTLEIAVTILTSTSVAHPSTDVIMAFGISTCSVSREEDRRPCRRPHLQVPEIRTLDILTMAIQTQALQTILMIVRRNGRNAIQVGDMVDTQTEVKPTPWRRSGLIVEALAEVQAGPTNGEVWD
mmetsp:Transcript_49877/g.116395  ORF Transcript_49877/g.116395 Transcript_49877/m.116395 type:complete len:215 (-) Transcript_49877:1055-1699(-)